MIYKTYKKHCKIDTYNRLEKGICLLSFVDVKNLNYLLSYKSNERFFTLWGVGTPTFKSL
jgi:hypothetical protein